MSFLLSFCTSNDKGNTNPDQRNTERRPVRIDSASNDGYQTKPEKSSDRITELENEMKSLQDELAAAKNRSEELVEVNENLIQQLKEKEKELSQSNSKEPNPSSNVADKEKRN